MQLVNIFAEDNDKKSMAESDSRMVESRFLCLLLVIDSVLLRKNKIVFCFQFRINFMPSWVIFLITFCIFSFGIRTSTYLLLIRFGAMRRMEPIGTLFRFGVPDRAEFLWARGLAASGVHVGTARCTAPGRGAAFQLERHWPLVIQ